MHARGYYLLSTEMKVIVISNLLYEQSERIYFWTSQNTRAAQKIKLNGKCIFVTVTYSYEVASDFLGSFCPTCARGRCHFCMGIFLKSLHYVIWIVYLINIHYVTIYDDYIVIICNNNNSTGSNEDGGSLHVWISSAAHSHRSNNLPVRLFAHNHARLSIVHIYYLNSIARS